jgi:hypothetical protein
MRTEAMLHDGTTIEIDVQGSGPDLLLPVRPEPFEGPQADEMRKLGVDPALGRSLIDGLADMRLGRMVELEPVRRTVTPVHDPVRGAPGL